MYFLDLLGTFAFAITGAYKAKGRNLHIFGVILLGIITAVGGGTFRDVIINRTPLFYLRDPNYLIVAILAGIITYFIPAVFKKAYPIFRFIDSVGLSAFVIIGTSVTYSYLFPLNTAPILISFLACVFLGMITGFGGGVIRDAIMGDMPFSFRQSSNYASSAFWGAFVFYLLRFWNEPVAVIASISVTMILREVISQYGLYKKVFRPVKKRVVKRVKLAVRYQKED